MNYKIRQFGKEINQGNVMVNPCEQGTRQSCTYCTFKSVCEYEPKVPGYETRILGTPSEAELLEKMRQEMTK